MFSLFTMINTCVFKLNIYQYNTNGGFYLLNTMCIVYVINTGKIIKTHVFIMCIN